MAQATTDASPNKLTYEILREANRTGRLPQPIPAKQQREVTSSDLYSEYKGEPTLISGTPLRRPNYSDDNSDSQNDVKNTNGENDDGGISFS